LLEAVDHEIGLLVIVDPVMGAHHALHVERDPVGRRIVEREDALAAGGDDARAVDVQGVAVSDQAELDRVPIKAGEFVDRIELLGAQTALAISLHIIGEDRVGEHRHMAEHVVEDVGLLQIIELVGFADELAGDEAAIGEMLEEDIVGDEARHRDHRPAGGPAQFLVEFVEIGNSGAGEMEHVEPIEEFLRGAAGQHRRLAREEGVPHRMLLRRVAIPILRDRPILGGVRRTGERVGGHGGSLQ